MEKQKEQFLTKRVLLSLCTAGVLALSVPNMASAADGDYQIWNDTPNTTESRSDGTVTQTGEPEAVNSGGGIIALTNYTINGQIWSGNGGEVNITGGTISSTGLPSSLLGEPLIQANQASISLSGVTVSKGDMSSDGNHILAENGGKIAIESSTVSADIASSGKGSAITVKDSTMSDAYAYGGGTITAENSSFDALIAGQYVANNQPQVVGSGSVKLTGGSVKDYIFATDGGTVETSGSTVNISNAAAFNGGTISIAGTAENAKANVTVKGSDDPKDIQPSTLYAYNKGQIALKNVELTMTGIKATAPAGMDKTFIHAEGVGSKITLENVTANITSSNNDDPEIFAEKGGHIELIKADFSSGSGDVTAKGNGSSVAITDSSVADLEAYEGGAITVKNSTVEAVHAGQHGASKEYTQGTIDIIGGVITDYVTAGGQGVVTITDAVLQGETGDDEFSVDGHSGGTVVLRGMTKMETPIYSDAAGNAFVGTIGAIDNGSVRIEGGTYGAKDADVQLITQTNGKIQLQGGKLYAHNFSKLQNMSLVLSGSGELVTTSGKIFEHGIDGANLPNVTDAKKWAANVTDAGAVYNQKIDFQGGKLILDDAFFTKAYLDSALQALHAVSDNKSQLDMFGTMINASGTVVTKITVDQVPNGAHLRNVTGTTDGNNLVLGTGSSEINSSIGLKNLDLGNAQNVTIKDGKSLTLYTGNANGELVASTGGDPTITVGGAGTTGMLTLGGDGNAAANQGTLSGTVNMANGKLKVVNGAYTIETLQGSIASTISVGDGQHKASLVVEKAALGGGTLFLDPAWNGSDRIDDASSAAVVFESNTGVRDHVDGRLIVGQNSILSLGTTDKTLAEKAFTRTGLQWGENGVTAALYVDTQQTFDATGSVFVDGTLTNPSPTAENFAANSLLIVNGAKIHGDTAAFEGTSSFAVNSDAKLYIANTNAIKAGEKASYQIFGDNITMSGTTSWGTPYEQDKEENKNIISNALSCGWMSADNKTVTIERQNASQVYSGIALANALDKININTASSNAGEAYLSRFLEGKAYKDASVARNINAAAQLAQTVGITKTSIDATQSIADTVTQRLSLAAEPEEGRAHEFWVKYIHDDTDVDSLSLAGNVKSLYLQK